MKSKDCTSRPPKEALEEVSFFQKIKTEKLGDHKSKKEAYDTFKQNLPNEKKDIFSILLGLEFLTYLRVVCKRIHIRYEDDQLVPRHPISFGFIIEVNSMKIIVFLNSLF